MTRPLFTPIIGRDDFIHLQVLFGAVGQDLAQQLGGGWGTRTLDLCDVNAAL